MSNATHATQLGLLAESMKHLGMQSLADAAYAGKAALEHEPTPSSRITFRGGPGGLVGWTDDAKRILSIVRLGDTYRLRVEHAQSQATEHESSHPTQNHAIEAVDRVLGALT